MTNPQKKVSEHLIDISQCPECRHGMLSVQKVAKHIFCLDCNKYFPIIDGRPVLLRYDNSLFRVDDYTSAERILSISLHSLNLSPSVNLARNRILPQLRSKLDLELSPCTILVVGGGKQRLSLDHLIGGQSSNLRIFYSDIDTGADVDLFCDGHDLPFKDGVVDAVVTTAVLEHVLYPERVASEIARVLKPGGLLYSELPFMQQVHEGAYDFTRYTLSGHRRLFNAFQEIDVGMVAGPATALVWSIENFSLAFVRRTAFRKLTKALVRVFFGWLKYFDHLMANRPEAMDGASCTYFFGSKAAIPVSDSEIIAKYVGAKHLTHT